MPLDNCKRCGRLYQKSISHLCKSCYTYVQSQSMEIYRYIQDNPGIGMEDLSAMFNMPVKDIESLIFSGSLGTANQLVRTNCAMCGCEMTFVNRIGYFCYACNRFVEKEAGVCKLSETEKKLDKLQKRLSANAQAAQEEEIAESQSNRKPAVKQVAQPKSNARSARFGFKRISGDTTR